MANLPSESVNIRPEAQEVVLSPGIRFETYLGGHGDEWFIRIWDGRRQVCLSAYEAKQLALFIKVVLT